MAGLPWQEVFGMVAAAGLTKGGGCMCETTALKPTTTTALPYNLNHANHC